MDGVNNDLPHTFWIAHAIASALQLELPQKPHFTLGYAVRKLLNAQLNHDSSLLAHLARQREILSARAKNLSGHLSRLGWQVLPPQGGLFLVAKPKLENGLTDAQKIVSADHAATKLFEDLDIAINNATWTGLPGYCRFVLSCSQLVFDEAIARLKQANGE